MNHSAIVSAVLGWELEYRQLWRHKSNWRITEAVLSDLGSKCPHPKGNAMTFEVLSAVS